MPTESAPPPPPAAPESIKCSQCGANHAADVCLACARDALAAAVVDAFPRRSLDSAELDGGLALGPYPASPETRDSAGAPQPVRFPADRFCDATSDSEAESSLSSSSSSASSSALRIPTAGLGIRGVDDGQAAAGEPSARLHHLTATASATPTAWHDASRATAQATPGLSQDGCTVPPKTTGGDRQGAPANPLLEVGRVRVPSVGQGPLYPGSIFRGTQTSGRSAYDVEVQIVDVNLPASTLCGYLSISGLTDTHPKLTTFFEAELIGPRFGFITGARYGATEPDDMRHWGRFEPFRRPATRADFVRPELLLRDPLPDASRGETEPRDRDFVFMRIKEKFLVPDHTVKDITGASFAGFYYAMLDLSPCVQSEDAAGSRSSPPRSPPPRSPPMPYPSTPRASGSYLPSMRAPPTSPGPQAPMQPRRASASRSADPTVSVNMAREGTRPGLRGRESSNGRVGSGGSGREATLRGYYFHSLNQEPFQELFLTHVPARSTSTFEMR